MIQAGGRNKKVVAFKKETLERLSFLQLNSIYYSVNKDSHIAFTHSQSNSRITSYFIHYLCISPFNM